MNMCLESVVCPQAPNPTPSARKRGDGQGLEGRGGIGRGDPYYGGHLPEKMDALPSLVMTCDKLCPVPSFGYYL